MEYRKYNKRGFCALSSKHAVPHISTSLTTHTLNFIAAVRPLAWHPGQWHGLRVAPKKTAQRLAPKKGSLEYFDFLRILLWIHSPSPLTSVHRIADWRGTLGGGVGRQSLHQRNVPDVEGCERPRKRRQRVAVGATEGVGLLEKLIPPPIVSCRHVDEFKKGAKLPKRPFEEKKIVSP